MEKYKYPYEPGKFGVPFEEIFQRIKGGLKQGTVISGSGRNLAYFAEEKSFGIRDLQAADRFLYARVDHGIATFNLQTRATYDYHDENEVFRIRHPDLFGKLFVGLSLQYFAQELGTEAITCRGQWQYWSDNFIAFNEELMRSGSKVRAAKNTRAGQVFMEYGFTEIDENDVKFESAHSENHCLTADFHKKIA